MRKLAEERFEPDRLRLAIEEFLARARRPALLEPGEPLLLLQENGYALECRPGQLVFQAWDERRNLVRRILGVERTEKGKLSLAVQRFGGKSGELFLVDLAHPKTQEWERRGSRMVFRERFRRMLEREFPGWRLAELSSEADLEHTLSPAYPRALLTRGGSAIAAISAPPDCGDFPSLLSFGVIWLEYLRQRDPRRAVQRLTFWAPSPVAPALSFYLPWLDSEKTGFAMYLYSDEDFTVLLDPRNYGNVATQLEPCRPAQEMPFDIEFTEAVERTDGSISLRVGGLELGRYADGRIQNGRDRMTIEEARANAASLHAMRNPRADRGTLIFAQNPEAWLESTVRAHLPVVDAGLRQRPLYGQVPAIAGQSRTVIDLLAVDHHGRLAVLELKASQDLHLPLQALDYWLRVQWHLERGEFTRYGYFPGIELRPDPPRLLLIAPSLDFHPTTETILRYFSPRIEVVRIGLSADWRENARVMFRFTGADRPHS